MHRRPPRSPSRPWALLALTIALSILSPEALAEGPQAAAPPRPAGILPTPRLPPAKEPRPEPLGFVNTPFLTQAAAQEVAWRPWSDALFKDARRTGKLVFLSIGASWCHWCHEMGRESFGDAALAELLNARFISVVVDRDLYPEVDRRYQRVVSTLSGRGGWPLTAVLTPSGDVVWGGGYVSAEDYEGRPGLISILERLADSFEADPSTIEARARGNTDRALALEAQIGRPRATAPPAPSTSGGPISPAPGGAPAEPWVTATALDHLVGGLLETWDPAAPGFGQAPRFPHGSALTLLLSYGSAMELSEPIDRALQTLDILADSSLRDPLTGLFFRYATDEAFNQPGFEILLTTNAQLLTAYVSAFQLTRRRAYAEVAEGIISGLTEELALKGGGFAASIGGGGPRGEGPFTVDPAALRAKLPPEEYQALSLRYGLELPSPLGEGRPHPLRMQRTLPEIARRMNLPLYDTQLLLARAEAALRKTRKSAKPGLILRDPTLQVAWNAQLATALFDAERILGSQEAGDAARHTVERIMGHLDPEQSQVPLVLGPEGGAGADLSSTRLLTAQCLLAAHDATGDTRYLVQARRIVDGTLQAFWDEDAGGFFDIAPNRRDRGLMDTRLKDLLDGVQPSTNGVGLQVLQSLSRWTGDPRYAELAREGLRSFEPLAAQLGPLGSAYGGALLGAVSPPPVVLIAGEGPTSSVEGGAATGAQGPLHRAATETYRPGVVLLSISPDDEAALAAFKLKAPWRAGPPSAPAPLALRPVNDPDDASEDLPPDTPVAWLCGDMGCTPPITSADRLRSAIQDYGRFPAPMILPPPGRPREVP